MALDDYKLKEKECEPIGNCDFEEDTCKTETFYYLIYIKCNLILIKVLGKTPNWIRILIGILDVVLLPCLQQVN
jgi:hypothetical protein